jgi:hypothetical protein
VAIAGAVPTGTGVYGQLAANGDTFSSERSLSSDEGEGDDAASESELFNEGEGGQAKPQDKD